MELTVAQKQQFYNEGFLQVSGVIPRVMVDAALKAINHCVGNGRPEQDPTTSRAPAFGDEVRFQPVIADLFNKTPALSLAESLIGGPNFLPTTGGQVALHFPRHIDPPHPPGPHLDGMYSPTNGVPQGTIGNFTMLVGVLLSDLIAPNSGNFTVWPGTHHLYEKYFQEHTPQSLLNGMPPVVLPEPHQIIGKAGDIVLCHYQLAHSAACNVSPHIRYAIFFRLTHVDHDKQKWEAMTDIWLEYAGVREVAKPIG